MDMSTPHTIPESAVAPSTQASKGKTAESEFSRPDDSPITTVPLFTVDRPDRPGPDSIGPYPERQPSSSVAPSGAQLVPECNRVANINVSCVLRSLVVDG